jgi:hypothetical protein
MLQGRSRMGKNNVNRIDLLIAVMAMALLPMTSHANAWTKTVIDKGGYLFGNPISDKAGNLYGTSDQGVFKLTPPNAGQKAWTQTPIYSFDVPNGGGPQSLLMDAAGNLYGVIGASGLYPGSVFKLTPAVAGQTAWTMTVLHMFGNNHFGPVGGLTMDAAGNLYGVVVITFEGDGQVYKLTRPAAGKTAWTETTLAPLVPFPASGDGPGVVFDKAGNLYGTDADTTGPSACPGSACGSVFKLTPPVRGNGAWKKTVIYRFAGGKDGAQPQGLLIGAAGVIYGATAGGGTGPCDAFYAGCGTIFKLAPPGPGKTSWTETVLYRFNPLNRDGPTPIGGLTFDRAGNLFGVTQASNSTNGRGTVYRLARPSQGNSAWTFSIPSQFYGLFPQDGLLIGPHGSVFGTADKGDASSGVVYQLTP